MTTSSNISRWTVSGSGAITSSIFSDDHTSLTQRMDDQERSTAIAAVVHKFWQAFETVPQLLLIQGRHQTYLEPTIIPFDILPEAPRHLRELHSGKKVSVSECCSGNDDCSPFGVVLYRWYCRWLSDNSYSHDIKREKSTTHIKAEANNQITY